MGSSAAPGPHRSAPRLGTGQTDDIIQDAFAPDDIDVLTRLVLANAIFFEADWASKFDKDETAERDFTLTSGDVVQVPLMCQEIEEASGIISWDDEEGEGSLAVLSIPYKDNEVSFIVLLPPTADGVEALEAELDSAYLDSLLADMSNADDTWTCLPKFTVEVELPLMDVLMSLGITDVFSPEQADLTGITAQENMADNYFVDVAKHRAYIEVDEEGTRAAAFTGFAVSDKGGGGSFVADHPFIYLIRDDLTGAILFMGRMEDPC